MEMKKELRAVGFGENDDVMRRHRRANEFPLALRRVNRSRSDDKNRDRRRHQCQGRRSPHRCHSLDTDQDQISQF